MIKMKLPIKRRKRKVKEGYDYAEDINWDNCTHKRKKLFDIKPEWQEDTVSIIIECKDCTRVGYVDATIEYDEEEIEW